MITPGVAHLRSATVAQSHLGWLACLHWASGPRTRGRRWKAAHATTSALGSRGAGSRPRSTVAFSMTARVWHMDGEATTRHKGKGPHRRCLDSGGTDEVDSRLWRRSDTRGSVATYAGRRRRGERQRKGVGATAGGATTLLMEGGARPGGDSSRRSDTRGIRHRRSKRHSSAATSGGRARSGGVVCSDTHGRERGAASNRLSGRAAGQCFMAWAQAWQRCCGSRRQLEMEHQRVGPGAESGDRQVGPWFELFPK
jgi:hypothetical protein